MSVSIRPSIDKNQKDFSLIFFVWYVVCKMEMARVNDGARLEEKKENFVSEDQKWRLLKKKGEGGNPGRSKNPPLLHVILFHIFSSSKGENLLFCRCLFLTKKNRKSLEHNNNKREIWSVSRHPIFWVSFLLPK
jgi:hypothetical protein